MPERAKLLFRASRTGRLAYRSVASTLGNRDLTWFDRAGKHLGTLSPMADYTSVALSPDGTLAAASQIDAQSGNRDLWLIDAARGIPTRFTFDTAEELDPVWSPDGSRVAFSSRRDGPNTFYAKDSSSAGKEERIRKAESDERPCGWSPDGRSLMYTRGPVFAMKLWVLSNPTGDPAQRLATPYLDTQFQMAQCQFSRGPAGAPQWVAYSSDESRQGREVYVQSFPEGKGKFQISNGGGGQPRWRRDGKELFYVAADGKLMAVDVKTAPRFEAVAEAFGRPERIRSRTSEMACRGGKAARSCSSMR